MKGIDNNFKAMPDVPNQEIFENSNLVGTTRIDSGIKLLAT